MTRSMVTRRTASAAAALLALALGGAGVAWACSPRQPHVGKAEGLASGPAGTQITITGRDFNPGPVEVRWNSRTGQLLGQAVGPNFSVSIKIPDSATVGVHYIMAIPSVGDAGSMAFEVTRAPTASPGTNGSTGVASTTTGAEEDSNTSSSSGQHIGDNDNSAATSAGDDTGGQSNTGSATAAAAGSGSTASAAAGSKAAHTATNVASTPPKAPTASGTATAGNGAERPAGAASANPAMVTTPAGQAVFGGSTATVSTGTPSAATVSGDTWSGFATDKPSLLSGGLETSSSGPTSAPGVGIGLLGAGVVALAAGFAAAESARKRALAGAQGHQEH